MSKKDGVWKVTENKTIIDSNYFQEQKVQVEKPVIADTIKYVRLQLMIDAHAHYDGKVSGRHYEWQRAGSVTPVQAEDAPYLLERRIKAQSCCNQSDNPVFQVVD